MKELSLDRVSSRSSKPMLMDWIMTMDTFHTFHTAHRWVVSGRPFSTSRSGIDTKLLHSTCLCVITVFTATGLDTAV